MKTRKGSSVRDWFDEEEARDPGFKDAVEIGRVKRRIAELVYAARKAADLTQSQLADRIHSSQEAVARIEAGEQNVSIELLERIAQAVGGHFEGHIVTDRRPKIALGVVRDSDGRPALQVLKLKPGGTEKVIKTKTVRGGEVTFQGKPRLKRLGYLKKLKRGGSSA